MVRSRRALVVAALLGVVSLAACTESQAGQPTPAESAGVTTTATGGPSGSTSPTVSIPARPRELRLDGVEACDLITASQLAQLKLDRKRPRANASQQYKGMRECSLDSSNPPFDHSVVTAITNEGIGAWLTGKRNVEAKLSSVAGYAAATFWIRGANGKNNDGCSTSVDVADGQQLMLKVDNDSAHSSTLEDLCQRVEQAAGLAMQTLQTLK